MCPHCERDSFSRDTLVFLLFPDVTVDDGPSFATRFFSSFAGRDHASSTRKKQYEIRRERFHILPNIVLTKQNSRLNKKI